MDNKTETVRDKTEGRFKDHRKLVSVIQMTRDDVVPYYADLIVSSGSHAQASRINGLILEKWKPSGLIYIKDKAWKTEWEGMTLYDAWLNNII